MDKYYKLLEAANLLGIKVRTAREWVKNGKLKAVKYPTSNMWFVPQSEITRIRGEVVDGNENREHSTGIKKS